MTKGILLFAIICIITNSFSKGEISFEKQREKEDLERQMMLKMSTEKHKEKSSTVDENYQNEEIQLFDDDDLKKSTNNISKNSRNINRKLADYIKTQNRNLRETEIKNILGYVFKYSRKYNFNPYIVLAVMNTESHFNHSTVSSAGARGLMQLMPFNFKEFGVDNSIEGNIKGGILHLKRDYEKTGSISKMLVCYNAGCSRLKNNEWKRIKETREYIPKVIEKYNRIINL